MATKTVKKYRVIPYINPPEGRRVKINQFDIKVMTASGEVTKHYNEGDEFIPPEGWEVDNNFMDQFPDRDGITFSWLFKSLDSKKQPKEEQFRMILPVEEV
jgi:hypothetical protein